MTDVRNPLCAVLHQRGVAEVQRNGDVRADHDPVHTVRAGGQHHALVMANREHGVPRDAVLEPAQTACTGHGCGLAVITHYTGRGSLAGGVVRDPDTQPVSTVKPADSHSIVVPYASGNEPGRAAHEPTSTLTTRDRLALVVPAGGTRAQAPSLADREPVPTQTQTEARAVVWTDEDIDRCRFRMFALHEIAGAMAMLHHTDGGEYVVIGNKRERMAQYGNAVTPPATALLVARLLEVLQAETFTDLFCGAGGSSLGAAFVGGELRLGLNHWARAIETHATNFQNADHDCEDVSSLTTAQIRRYPDSDILLASPECTNHSLAKGARRRKPQAASLFDDGPGGSEEQDRSRATMWDVCRFAEQKILKGRPYKAIVVENVVDAFKWGADDDGGLFNAWLSAMRALGYEHEIVWLNSMFAHGPAGLVPQSRDRMYVVFWQRGIRTPDLRVEPASWCPHCERVVDGRQTWKRPGPRVWGRYGAQYFYTCPNCHGVVLPGAAPAMAIIDATLPAVVIGERKRPLATNTLARIRRGLERLANEPFAIRLTHAGAPRPLTLPLVTLTQRHDVGVVLARTGYTGSKGDLCRDADLTPAATVTTGSDSAVVLPVAGNTHENSPGNRARRAAERPLDTVHATLDRALRRAADGRRRPAAGCDGACADTDHDDALGDRHQRARQCVMTDVRNPLALVANAVACGGTYSSSSLRMASVRSTSTSSARCWASTTPSQCAGGIRAHGNVAAMWMLRSSCTHCFLGSVLNAGRCFSQAASMSNSCGSTSPSYCITTNRRALIDRSSDSMTRTASCRCRLASRVRRNSSTPAVTTPPSATPIRPKIAVISTVASVRVGGDG